MSNGTVLQQSTCNGNPQQYFWLIPQGNGTLRIMAGTGRTLDVRDNNRSNGTPIQQWEFLG